MMKRILLSGIVVFLFSLFTVACNNDNDDNPGPTGSNNNPDDSTQVEDPTLTVFISGDVADTITYVMTGGIATENSIIGSYSSAALGLLSINAAQLPTGWSLSLIGNADDFAEGTFKASGQAGYGALNNSSTGEGYLGTSSTITITELELVQDVVYETFNAWGTFELTVEDQNSGGTVQITGSFSNISITAN